MYGPCISEFLNRALEKYASRVCVIINHVRDRGTNIPGISNRKKRLYENIALYLTNRKSRTIIPEDENKSGLKNAPIRYPMYAM